MAVRTSEIAKGVYRFSTLVSEIAAPLGFTFNQYLIVADEPLLFHTGPRHMFGDISDAVSRIMRITKLRWVSFGHIESDECGSMNQWLAVVPNAQIVHGATACMVSLNDLADRPPRSLADGEVLDLGGKRVQWLDTPHVPHAWESGLIYEESGQTLFCGDLFTQAGDGPSVTKDSIVAAAAQTEDMFKATALTPQTAGTIRRCDARASNSAVMHGSCFAGDCALELNQLADYYEGAMKIATA